LEPIPGGRGRNQVRIKTKPEKKKKDEIPHSPYSFSATLNLFGNKTKMFFQKLYVC
jgi:hypothetical protein